MEHKKDINIIKYVLLNLPLKDKVLRDCLILLDLPL